jgi:tetratricopeptide (TPR) repeat protein
MEAARGRFEDALKWSDEALTRGNDIAELHADRAFILLNLGMLTDVGIAYRRAAAGNADSVHQNPMLTIAGAASAIDGGGVASLATFIRDNELEKSEVPSVLFALANVSLIVGNDKQARVYVDRALESKLLQPEDVASPWDARIGQSSLLVTATALRATGDAAGAERRLDELAALLTHLVDSGVQTPGLYELRAQLAAMRGKADEAMTELNHAAQLGWTAAWMAEHQPYFNSLRARADFRALLAAVSAKNAATAAKLRPRLSIVSGLLRRPAGSAATSE